MIIRRAVPADRGSYRRLRAELWPGMSPAENLAESAAVLEARDQAVFLAETPRGETVGFAEVSLRGMAEGCSTRPVGYLEGWYVQPSARHRGVGRRLLEAGEQWARAQGCSEMASDTEIENIASQEAHQRLGYEIVSRAVLFRKPLT